MVDGRIHALARAHNQITDDHWGPAPLQALIDAEAAAFLPHGAGAHRHRGRRRAAQPAGLFDDGAGGPRTRHQFHQVRQPVGTAGRCPIAGIATTAGDLVLTWRETAVRPSSRPTRKGFGTTIIERSVPYDLGGEAKIDYVPNGVDRALPHSRAACLGGTPRRRGRRTYPPPRDRPPHRASPRPLPRRPAILLVEDSLIIALDAEDILTRLGAEVSTAATVEAALERSTGQVPTRAMLDINLGDQTSFAIADRLAELGVPFLFATGYGEQALLPELHKHRSVVQKPYTLEGLARVLKSMQD